MKNKHIKLIIHVLCIIIFLIVINRDIKDKKIKEKEKIEEESIDYIIENTIDDNIDQVEDKKIITKEQPSKKINYTLILEIPKIELKKGILNKDDKDNNIDKNVTILKESSYPNEDGNIFLAAHSGNGRHSYFNNLVNLKKNDQAYLYYNNKKYIYYVSSIKEVDKNDEILLISNKNNNLYLITCSQKNKDKYLVVIFSKTKD